MEPATLEFKHTFISSPLFSVDSDGVHTLPDLEKGAFITFLMVPNIFPTFSEIKKLCQPDAQLWFSIGLANLIIFEPLGVTTSSDAIVVFLNGRKIISGAERWTIAQSHIDDHTLIYENAYAEVYNCKLTISDKLPLNLKFAVSEYIISVDRFLTASKRFTPHYFGSHQKTIAISNKILVDDISFLNGDDTFTPSDSIVRSLGAKDATDASANLFDPKI